MNYEELSDFEINKRVAELRPYTWIVDDGSCPAVSGDAVSIEYKTFKYGNLVSHGADYCNHPEDAWPIITEMMNSHIFTISDVAIVWHGESDSDDVIIECKNPLRAAMICYLMMQEAK